MKLFNKFQSRAFQFALDLLVELKQSDRLNRNDIQQMAMQYGLNYLMVLKPLLGAGIVEQEGQYFQLAEAVQVPSMPISKVEEQYLQYILGLPVAQLFLDEETIEKIGDLEHSDNALRSIQCYRPNGETTVPPKDTFRVLLKAMKENRLIKNTYRVRGEPEPKESIVLPWKLEYDAVDSRWWVILYHPEEKRMIKARLRSFQNIELLGTSSVTSEEIEQAMERLLEPEAIVLRVKDTRGALERCFLAFESQLFEETRKLSEDLFELTFRYYKFDRSEILRRLLYLGSPVTLVRPSSLREELLGLVNQALQVK